MIAPVNLRHRLFAAVLPLLLAGPAPAEPSRAADLLELADVLAAVDRTFPLLQAAELEVVSAEGELLAAQGGFDIAWRTRGTLSGGYYESVQVDSTLEQPTGLWGVSAFAGYRLGVGTFPSYDGKLETLEHGEVRAGVHIPVLKNGPIDRRRASLQKARLGRRIAELTVDEQRLQFRRAAAHRYWAWVAAGKRLRIAEALLRNVEGRAAALSARIEHGDLPALERTDNERAIQQRRAQVALARRGLEQAALELSLYARDETGAALPPPPERLPADFPGLPAALGSDPRDHLRTAEVRRPEARKLALQGQQAEVERDFAKNQLAPAVDLQLLVSQDLGPPNPDRPDLSDPVAQVGVVLEVPLQNRAMRGRLRSTDALVARLRQQEAFAQDKIEVEVADALSGIRRALERVDAARQEVQLALELERSERARFEEGDSHLLIVNLREQQTAEAELREVDAVLDYYRAAADLAAARGG